MKNTSIKNILLIGGQGELGEKISKDLKSDKYKIIIYDKLRPTDNGSTGSKIEIEEDTTAIIVSPPKTHVEYIKNYLDFYSFYTRWGFKKHGHSKLIQNKKINLLLCEKPLPNIEKIKQYKHNDNVKIVDHYLFKDNIQEIIEYFKKNKNRIDSIKMFLCEPRKEHRPWMLKRSQYGGTVYDLGHHLLAIIGKLFGFHELRSIINLQVHFFETYNKSSDSSDKKALFSFEINGYKIHCHTEQDVQENKKIIFSGAGKSKAFPLDKGKSYAEIISSANQNNSMLLQLEDAFEIDSLLETIISKGHAKISIKRMKRKLGNDSSELLQDLNSKFLHRHSFYWSSFWKLFIYHLFLITLPGIIYYYLTDTEVYILSTTGVITDSIDMINFNIVISCGFLSVIIFLFIRFYSLKRTDKYLDDEEHRMKLILEKIREIYSVKYGLNIYPGNKKLMNSEEIFEDLERKKFLSNKGLGSDYMFEIFKKTCLVGSVLSIIFFFWLYISEKNSFF